MGWRQAGGGGGGACCKMTVRTTGGSDNDDNDCVGDVGWLALLLCVEGTTQGKVALQAGLRVWGLVDTRAAEFYRGFACGREYRRGSIWSCELRGGEANEWIKPRVVSLGLLPSSCLRLW